MQNNFQRRKFWILSALNYSFVCSSSFLHDQTPLLPLEDTAAKFMKQKMLKQSKVPNTCYNCFHQMCFQGLSLITASGSCRMHIDEGGEDRGHCSLCYYWLLSTLCVCTIWKDTHYPTLQADQQYNVILCACCSKSIFRNKASVSLIWV